MSGPEPVLSPASLTRRSSPRATFDPSLLHPFPMMSVQKELTHSFPWSFHLLTLPINGGVGAPPAAGWSVCGSSRGSPQMLDLWGLQAQCRALWFPQV